MSDINSHGPGAAAVGVAPGEGAAAGALAAAIAGREAAGQRLVERAPVRQAGQRIAQRVVAGTAHFVAQAVDLAPAVAQALLQATDLAAHRAGIGDHLGDDVGQLARCRAVAGDTGRGVGAHTHGCITTGERPGQLGQRGAVTGGVGARGTRGLDDAAEHALHLVDDALRGVRVDVGHVASEQRLGGELVERTFARQMLVDGGAQRRIGLGDVVEPHGVAHRMQPSRLTRHPRQRLTQQLGAALDAHLVSQSDLNNNGVYKGPPSANGAHSCRAFCLGVTSRYVTSIARRRVLNQVAAHADATTRGQ
jgi:hypothetical protein